MEMRRYKETVCFVLRNSELLKYGVNVRHMKSLKPFTVKLVLDLMRKAHNAYGMDFDIDHCELQIHDFGKYIGISFKEKSKIVYFENEYSEDEQIVKGLHNLFCMLPDEQINFGLIDVDKKTELLKKIRSDEGREIIREMFM